MPKVYRKKKQSKMPAKRKRAVRPSLKRQLRRLKGSNIMINPTRFNLHMPFPKGYFTTFRTVWTSVVAAGLAAKNTIALFQANNPFTPFSVLASPFQTGVDESSAYTVKNPAGLTQVIATAGLYNSYHVLRCKLRITCMVGALGDSLMVGIAPTLNSGTTYGSMGSLEQGPRSKTKQFTTSNSASQDSISYSLDIPNFFGLSLEEYLADPSSGGNYSAGPVGLGLAILECRYQVNDNAVTSVASSWKFELEYDTYCEQSTTGGLADI